MTEKRFNIDCVYFDDYQDTDDEGKYIAPPVLCCELHQDKFTCVDCNDYLKYGEL